MWCAGRVGPLKRRLDTPSASRTESGNAHQHHVSRGQSRLQDQFDSRRISDRIEEKLTRTEFTPSDKSFIESVPYFFFATADAEGRPIAPTKAACPASYASPDRLNLLFLIMTAMECLESWQCPHQSQCRIIVHRHAWQTTAAACQWPCDPKQSRPAPGRHRRRSTHRSGRCAGNFSELSALYSHYAADRTLDLRAEIRLRGAGTGVEGFR